VGSQQCPDGLCCHRTVQTDIYTESAKAAKEYKTHLQAGANIAGFLKVAEAMVGLDPNCI
jgi:glutamate dehydrogenase/leucine dehydrogenase